MAHKIVWVEISAQNRKASADFYNDVFGWTYRHIDDMNYTTLMASGEEEGVDVGLTPVSEQTPAGDVVVYIETDDVEATLEKVTANGGKVIAEPMDIPDVGRMAIFTDPTGNKLALMKWVEPS